MLLLGIITLVMTIPLASLYLSTIFIYRFTLLIILYSALLLYNILYDVIPLSMDIGLLGGLFQITILSQNLEFIEILGRIILSLVPEGNGVIFSSQGPEEFSLLLFTSLFMTPPQTYGELDSVLTVAVIVYSNVESNKSIILSDNKDKAGIYQWTHLESNKIYIGSAVDLSKRFKNYYSAYSLKQVDNYISRALLHHGHSAFSLTILEYIDITNLSKEEVRKLILEREQHFLDLIFSEDEPNTYNILKIAGNLLGFRHSEETLVKMYGKSPTPETIAKMSEAKTGENHPMYGKTHTTEVKAKMSATLGTAIYVYDLNGTLVNTFNSARKAAEYFNSNHVTIMKYVKNKKLYQEQWILSMSIITKD
jgi:group I intron endonuclease